MQSRMKKIISLFLVTIIVVLSLTGCSPTATPSVVIAYKTNGLETGEYSESIEKFTIGNDMYCCVVVKIVTDKKKAHTYDVEVTVPKTKDVEIIKRGGLDAREVVDDTANEQTIMRFDVAGSKEAVQQKIMFKGTPVEEGDATVQVTIYDKGEKVYGYSSTVDFVYE